MNPQETLFRTFPERPWQDSREHVDVLAATILRAIYWHPPLPYSEFLKDSVWAEFSH